MIYFNSTLAQAVQFDGASGFHVPYKDTKRGKGVGDK